MKKRGFSLSGGKALPGQSPFSVNVKNPGVRDCNKRGLEGSLLSSKVLTKYPICAEKVEGKNGKNALFCTRQSGHKGRGVPVN